MARNESNREDLMAEAVSLVQRIEFVHATTDATALVGVNQLGWLFVYLNDDTMYRFDEQGRLRRAYLTETLYRTTGHTLAAMTRSRRDASNDGAEPAESLLLRRDLSPQELSDFRERMMTALEELLNSLHGGSILRQHPLEIADLAQQLALRIQQVLESSAFLAPAIVRR